MAIQEQSIALRANTGMIFIPSGNYLMGSDNHYLEEAPAHRVIVDPPSQRAHSFTIDQLVKKMQRSMESTR